MIKLFTYIQLILLALSVIALFLIPNWTIRLSIIAADIALLTNLFSAYKGVKIIGTICCVSIVFYLWFLK